MHIYMCTLLDYTRAITITHYIHIDIHIGIIIPHISPQSEDAFTAKEFFPNRLGDVAEFVVLLACDLRDGLLGELPSSAHGVRNPLR